MIFSHKVHIEIDVECLTCHDGIENSENDLNSHLPSMGVCEECHDEVKDADNCVMCHPDLGIKRTVRPESTSHLNFSHVLHLDMEVECVICHAGAPTSNTSDDELLPENAFKNNNHAGVCTECHDDSSPDNCTVCHPEPGTATALLSTSSDLKFSHRIHVDMAIGCQTCHVSILNSDNIISSRIPKMEVCGECHDEVETECIMCHRDIKEPVLLTKTETALNFSHKFHIDEGADECSLCHENARVSEHPLTHKIPGHKDCFQCHHEEDYDNMLCSKCHRNLGAKELKPITTFSHKANFLKRHGEYVSKDNRGLLCAQCHMDGFCMDCHSSRPIITANEKNRFDKDRNFIHRGDYQSSHYIEARRDASLCVKCHRTSFCQNCHSRKGFALDLRNQYDVHPSDFLMSHGRAARRDILTCAVCHEKGAATSCIECHAIDSSGAVGPGGNPHPPGFKTRLSKSRDAACILCHKN
ncbi:MAG: hypothetical protein JSW20_14795 [Nitrospiraceae bacterium]|nr:MAG: hypothetical protein JSW20_14795 [Nitrospiraceae bacterium]